MNKSVNMIEKLYKLDEIVKVVIDVQFIVAVSNIIVEKENNKINNNNNNNKN